MKKISYGFICDPNPDAEVDLDSAKEAIAVFLNTMKIVGAQDSVAVTIVTGPVDHPLSDTVRKEAARLGLAHKFGPDWGKNPSTFIRSCDTLVRVGDDHSAWCRQQEEMFRRAGGEVFVMFL